ncbi:MAG: hypothetical protein ACFCBW_09630 [Candidatus Competibacterales bacterium]
MTQNITHSSPLLITLLAIGVAIAPALANAAGKPITGVGCQGGFFVKNPKNQIFWIGAERNYKTSVYQSGHPVMAMAECGDGVVTIFNTSQGEALQYSAYFSADCRNLGQATGNTTLLYSGPLPVVRISPQESGVELKLADDTLLHSESCRR